MAIIRNNNINLDNLTLDDSQRNAVFSEDEKISIKAPAGSGKSLRHGTKVLTAQGWKPIECLTMADRVAGSDGRFYGLNGIFPQGRLQVYRVIFSDGSIIECSADHLWTYQDEDGDWRTSITKEILALKRRVAVPVVKPIQFESPDAPTTSARLELVRSIVAEVGQYISEGEYILHFTSAERAREVKMLCEELGYVASQNNGGTLHVWMCDKACRFINKIVETNRYEEMTCISVQSKDHLFVVENCILTHNTLTLIAAIANYRYEHINDRICAITYTRAARAEMEQRLREMGVYDVEVTTIHVWSRNLLYDFSIKYDFKIKILTEAEIKEILRDLVRVYLLRSKVRSINIDILYTYITGTKNMDITENYRRTLNALEERYIGYKRSHQLYDFTDYPLYLNDVLNTYKESINNIDALFVDEFQDVDPIQLDVFKKVNSSKKFFIGDLWQCQPCGSQVKMADGTTKSIEFIVPGDEVISYDKGSGTLTPAKVARVRHGHFADDYLVTVHAGGRHSTYTPNHRTFVQLNLTEELRSLALIKLNGVYTLREIALADIPSIDYDALWLTSTQAATELLVGKELLEACGLDDRYPLLVRGMDVRAPLETCAANLRPRIMNCLVCDEVGAWHLENVDEVERTFITDPITICCLEVEGTGTYICDDLITHNSIYVFRGADGESFKKLDNFTKYKLKYNYRSYQEIIDYASVVYEQLLPRVQCGEECYITQTTFSRPSSIVCDRGYGGKVSVVDSSDECVYEFTNNKQTIHYDVFDAFEEILDKQPQILCRTNKQVRAIQEYGFMSAETVHQAKGLEYNDVIVIDTEIKNIEDLNIAYVAITRAKNSVLITSWNEFEWFLRRRW